MGQLRGAGSVALVTSVGASAVVRARHVLTPSGSLSPGEVRIGAGRIQSVSTTSGPVDDVVVAPGFIDLQVNGVDDVDCARADEAGFDRLDGLLAASGVTAWLPTLVSQPLARYARPLEAIAVAAARGGPRPTVLGAHLEGPFLGGRPGAHRPQDVIAVDLDWLASLPDIVRLVTIAPEALGSTDAIRALVARGVVVSLGHSAADIATSTHATDAGASMVTHLFNGMGPLHHRAPGIAGLALADDRLAAGLIADLVHIDPALLRIAFRAKGADRIVLVSDAVAWRAGHLVDQALAVVEGAPRLSDGTIAGSVLTLDQAVRNTVEHAGVSLADAVRAASTTPADVLGLADRGRISAGAHADLVVLDADDLTVRRTLVGGVTIHES